MKATNLTIGILIIIIIGLIGFLLTHDQTETTVTPEPTTEEPIPVEPDNGIGDGAEPLDELIEEATDEPETALGNSVNGTEITAYHYGEGTREIVLIGGIHGGYSWSTAALGFELVDHFEANESTIPENLKVTVIPVMNPDGLESAVGTAGRFSATLANELTSAERVPARFNANDVDLNRNFDCDWSETATWQSREVSGGSEAFSEPEAAAIRDYILEADPAAVVVWFGAEGKVYPSACEDTPSDASVALAATFATAADYPAEAEFDAYAITGDMVNWIAGEDIPAISVLLSSHSDTEFEQNIAGVDAILDAYGN